MDPRMRRAGVCGTPPSARCAPILQ